MSLIWYTSENPHFALPPPKKKNKYIRLSITPSFPLYSIYCDQEIENGLKKKGAHNQNGMHCECFSDLGEGIEVLFPTAWQSHQAIKTKNSEDCNSNILTAVYRLFCFWCWFSVPFWAHSHSYLHTLAQFIFWHQASLYI